MTYDEFRALAAKAGLAHFWLDGDTMPRADMFIIGADFLSRLHSELAPAPSAPQPMSEHNTRFAIDGAIQYGREDRNKPPSDDHWLMEYWLIGQQLRELGKTGWDNVTPLDPAERVVVAPSAPVAPETPVAALMYMDELPAAQAGEAWIQQFAKEADKVMYSPDEGAQSIRVKWCAYFDSYDRLVAAYLLTRDAKNWTQLSRVRGEPFAPRADLSVKAGSYPEIPEGWQLVPKTATDEMHFACHTLNYADEIEAEWKAMLAAAPTPPTTGEA